MGNALIAGNLKIANNSLKTAVKPLLGYSKCMQGCVILSKYG